MTGATHMHGEENGFEGRDVLVATVGALVVAGDLLDFERKEEGNHHENEADGDHDGGKDWGGFGDEGGRDDHGEQDGEAKEAEYVFES